MKAKLIGYWIVTAIFCLGMTVGGIADLLHTKDVADVLQRLRYPEYVATILGVAKLFGVVALLLPGTRVLKEWAYAGFAFDLVGALASHAFTKDPPKEFLGAGMMLLFCIASYLLRPQWRRVPGAWRL